MSSGDERKSGKYGDSSKLTNWILDSGATSHMTPEFTDSIPGSLEDTDKFIATLYNVLLAPNLCNRLFSIITLMNSGHNCLFHKGFCTVYF